MYFEHGRTKLKRKPLSVSVTHAENLKNISNYVFFYRRVLRNIIESWTLGGEKKCFSVENINTILQ